MANTMYEVVLQNGRGGEKLLVQYTSQKSRRGLIGCVHKMAESLVKVTGADEYTILPRAAHGVQIGDYRCFFSGRTKLDAKQEGEHRFVGEVAQ